MAKCRRILISAHLGRLRVALKRITHCQNDTILQNVYVLHRWLSALGEPFAHVARILFRLLIVQVPSIRLA